MHGLGTGVSGRALQVIQCLQGQVQGGHGESEASAEGGAGSQGFAVSPEVSGHICVS